MNSERLGALGWRRSIDLREGLATVYAAFLAERISADTGGATAQS